MKKNIIKIILAVMMIISILGIILTICCAKNNAGIIHQLSFVSNYKLIIGIFTSIFCLSLLYLISSRKNKKFYKNVDKLIIYILENIILVSLSTIILVSITNNFILNNKSAGENSKTNVTLDKSNIVTDNEINLSNETTDITITNGGTYKLNGSFTHSIIIDAEDEDVEIILNGVEINTETTATIIGLSAKSITIITNEDTTNILSDGGSSDYDGCIFSNAPLIFDGDGILFVYGNQKEGEGIATETQNITFNGGTYNITSNDDGINAGGDGATIVINNGVFYINASGDGIDSNKDAIINGGTIFVIGSDIGGDSGIDTDDGYEINGGFVVALGSDMIETPKNTSIQNTIAFTLENNVNKDIIVTLMKDDEVIVSFTAPKSFKTIIISNENLTYGDYKLYVGGTNTGNIINGVYLYDEYTKGEQISINNNNVFNVNSVVNIFGSNINWR